MIKIFERDAIDVNVKPGGLTGTTQIKILICYLLTVIKRPIECNDMKTVLHYEGLANFFEVCNAIAELEKSGHITTVDFQNELCYVATSNGMNVARELELDVPITVREGAVSAIEKVQRRKRNEKENKVDIKQLDLGYSITCTVMDGHRELMSVTLYVPDKECAKVIKEKFLNDPSKIFIGISEILTNDI